MEFTSQLSKSDCNENNFVKRLVERTKGIETLRQEALECETQMADAKKQKDEAIDKGIEKMLAERVELQQKFDELQKKFTELVEEKKFLKVQLDEKSNQLQIYSENYLKTQSYLHREIEHRRTTDRQILKFRKDVDVKTGSLNELNIERQNLKCLFEKTEFKYKKYKEECKNEIEELSSSLGKLKIDFEREAQEIKNSIMEKEIVQLNVRNLINEINDQKIEISISEIKLQNAHKKLLALEIQLKKQKEEHRETSERSINKSLNRSTYAITKKNKNTAKVKASTELKETQRDLEMKYMSALEKIQKQESEINSFRNHVSKAKSMAAGAEAFAAEKEKKIQTLLKDLSAKDGDIRRLNVQLSSLAKERNRIKCLLYKKITLIEEMKAAVDKDLDVAKIEQYCMDLIRDKRLLKAQLSKKSQTCGLLQKRMKSLPVLRQKLTKLRNLLAETKVNLSGKRLEEDVTKPTNIHQMQLLAGTNPEADGVFSSNIFVQKKLTKINIQLAMKENELDECNEIKDLKKIGKCKASYSEILHKYNLENEITTLKEELNKATTSNYIQDLKSRR